MKQDYKIGILKKWVPDKHYGFIESKDLDNDIFVHISQFVNRQKTPKEGDVLRFYVGTSRRGKTEAKRVLRLNEPLFVSSKPYCKVLKKHSFFAQRFFGKILMVLALILLVRVGFLFLERNQNTAFYDEQALLLKENTSLPQKALPKKEAKVLYVCDGRIYCSQMTSCDEAKFFLKNCPNTRMDGNRDGIPCESQWCIGF